MEMLPNVQEKTCGVVDLIKKREIQESIGRTVFNKLHVTDSLIARLGLEAELNGHTGCVNCLEWNESGDVLASASDDKNIILWDPFRYKKKVVLETGHNGNIFSVKFMPKSSDNVLVSGAGDCRVRVHDLTLTEPTLACHCHTRRVKRIATSPLIPFMFWTAAEDGFVLQYDMRTPHTCKSESSNNVLINLVHHLGIRAEGKCITINPKKPELIAIGANDEYIRMYDRRMIKLSKMPVTFSMPTEMTAGTMALFRPGEGDPDNNIPLRAAQYFVAGHLRSQQRDSNRSLTTTYVTFSADGNELLANMGGEQIYLFDINEPRQKRAYYGRTTKRYTGEPPDDVGKCAEKYDTENGEDLSALNVKTLPPRVEEIKRQANTYFENRKYAKAINLYNKAISLCPTAAVLFANRGASYMKRAWDGDTYAAVRDCQTTLLLDPMNVKAHYRLVRCLLDLNQASEAEKVIKVFQRKHPMYASHPACKALKMDIKKAIESGKEAQTNQYHLSHYEKEWRRNTIDYKTRFCGHCNTTTDIKEANFFGNSGQYIAAGSDDGSLFIWDRNTTNILRVLVGDNRIVNCLQPHPSTCLLATSGIEPIIRLWSPMPEDGTVNKREIPNLDDAAAANQIRMNSDPFDVMLMNMGYRVPLDDDIEEIGEPIILNPLDCRPS